MPVEMISTSLPERVLRMLIFLLVHSFYRIKLLGRGNLPREGGALLVCNHASFVDAFLLLASIDRPVRLLMNKEFYERPWLNPLARMINVIPVSSEQHPREMLRSLRQAGTALRSGELVCIFPEGEVTRTGRMLPFRRGMELIMKGVDAPILPVNLDGIWGSIFSYERGRFLWKRPRRVPYPVTISFGKPLPANSELSNIRQAVLELQSQAFRERRRHMKPLDSSFLRSARLHPLRPMMADAQTATVSYLTALVRAIHLARQVRNVCGEDEMVGLLLPPSIHAALANLAVALLGRVPVNLDCTTSSVRLDACTRQCKLNLVITSRALAHDHPSFTDFKQVLYIEDLEQAPEVSAKLKALLAALFLPHPLLSRWLGARRRTIDDVATVIFTRHGVGKPLGAVWTHYGLSSNLQQLLQVLRVNDRDRMLGSLPFSDPVGFMAALWAPAVCGLGVVYPPSAFDARAVEELTVKHKVTLMVATPELLRLYLKRCTPERLGSLERVFVISGELPEELAQAFEDTFGIRPMGGYSSAECGPVVSVSGHNYRAAGFHQVASRRGTRGQSLPGMSVRVVNRNTDKPVSPGTPGLLLVKGPNLMKGYLEAPQETSHSFRGDWYNTGETAILGQDDFLDIIAHPSRLLGDAATGKPLFHPSCSGVSSEADCSDTRRCGFPRRET